MLFFRRSRYHQTSTTTNPNSTLNDSSAEYQLFTERSVLGAALNQMISSNTRNSIDETRLNTSDGFSIVSAPKNVKFLIPLGRSGVTSNESTYGLVESTSRTITHVKDIFPLNSSVGNSSNVQQTNVIGSSSSQTESLAADSMRNDSEDAPLLNEETFNQKSK